MNAAGSFFGIGVGPGQPGLITLAAWERLKKCDVIFVPRARSMEFSVAQRCLPAGEIPPDRFREIEFTMDSDRTLLSEHYADLAETIAAELRAGKDVAYLTLGDPFTYSTYSYTLAALRDRLPALTQRTFPGVTSYCALAAAAAFPLGEGKEHVLILPCPDEMTQLRAAIDSSDVVVLMKIGDRLPAVLSLVQEMEIAPHCVFGKRVGIADEEICAGVADLDARVSNGYLSTMLIRKTAPIKRHREVCA